MQSIGPANAPMLQDRNTESNVNVESENDVKTFSSPFLLDHISLIFTLLFFGCLIAFLLFRSNNVSERSSYYPCNQSFHYYSLHLDLSIDSFTELHRQVKVWIAGERNTTDIEDKRPLNYTVDKTGLYKKSTIDFVRTDAQQTSMNWPKAKSTSEKIYMTTVKLNSSFDQIKVHFILNSDFIGFKGMYVYWRFNTAPKPSYVTFLQILLPSTTLYLTIHYLFHFTSMTEQFTQINIAVLGFVAILASLPYNLIFGKVAFGFYAQFVFTAGMVAYFRYIVTSQIQLEAEGTQSPSMSVNLPLIIFFSAYAILDMAVAFSGGTNAGLFTLLIRGANILYAVIAALITGIAFLTSESGHSRRMVFMIVLEAMSMMIVFRDQTYEAIRSATEVPLQRNLTFGASHVFMVSYLLILLQICSDVGYTEIEAHNNDQSSLLQKDKGDLELNVDPELEEDASDGKDDE